MFALEIRFHDGASPPETILLRRPHAIVGNSDFAHVVVEGADARMTEIRVSRGVGREFHCEPLPRNGKIASILPFVPGTYSGEAEVNLGGVSARIVSLDIDLAVGPQEDPAAAEARVLRLALGGKTPVFPAVAVLGQNPVVVSFPAGTPVLIGRSRNCGLRLDAADVSSEHARMRFEGEQLWIEDLQSTNGTYVRGERVRGERAIASGEPVLIGSEILIAGLRSAEELTRVSSTAGTREQPAAEQGLPFVIANSEFIQPAQLELRREGKITIGRDPACDIWIPAGHISRVHAEMRLNEAGQVEVTDLSSNGIYIRGNRLAAKVPVMLSRELNIMDFRRGVRLGVCYSAADLEQFRDTVGSSMTEGETAAETVAELNTAGSAETRAPEPAPPEKPVPEGAGASAAGKTAEQESSAVLATSAIRSEGWPRRREVAVETGGALSANQKAAAGVSDVKIADEAITASGREEEDKGGDRLVAERREARKATLINGRLGSEEEESGFGGRRLVQGFGNMNDAPRGQGPGKNTGKQAAQGKGSRLPLIILTVSVLLLILVAAALVFSMFAEGGFPPPQEQESETKVQEQ